MRKEMASYAKKLSEEERQTFETNIEDISFIMEIMNLITIPLI